MSYKSLLLSSAVLAMLASPVAAQTYDEIVVTASRLNQTQTEIGSSVSVITSDDIKLLGVDFAVDAIASAPGVTVSQNGAYGGQAQIRIRGAVGDQTLVLIDGVAVNDASAPGGNYDFGRLDSGSIEKIEILKGPQSTLWGTDAIGGVVSITTKRPEDGFGGELFAEYGSFDTKRGGVSVHGKNESGDFRLAVNAIDTDGISKADEIFGNTEKDGYNSLTLSGRGGVNLPSDARLELSALYTDADTDFDSFVFGAPGNVGDGDESAQSEDLSVNATLRVPLLQGRFENMVMLGHSQIDRQNFAGEAPSFGAQGERLSARYQGNLEINETNTIAFGAEHEKAKVEDDERTINGVFGLYEFKPAKALTLTAGLRHDDDKTFGAETTARIAAAFNPTDLVTLRASWGEGFKAPTLFHTTFFCCGAAAPNADLKAERSNGFDIGADFRTPDGRGQIGVTYFDQSVENLITFSFADGGYSNIPGAETSGVEIFGDYELTDWLSVAANYSNISAKDNAGERLIRVPKHSGHAALRLDPEGPFSGAILARYNGKQLDSDAAIDDWTRIDLTAAYALNETVEFYGRVENLFDVQYQQLNGYGTPGLSGSAGVRLRY